jgi:PAS domain S-box-containing protein
MPDPVRLLLVADSDAYAARVVSALAAKGLQASSERVASADEMRDALSGPRWDAAVTDLGVPAFEIEDVVALAKGSGPDLPVIAVSEMASKRDVERALRAGVAEFVPMADLECVVCAVKRVIREAEVKRELLVADEQVHEKDALLRGALDAAPAVIFTIDLTGTVTLVEGEATRLFGLNSDEAMGRNVLAYLDGRMPDLADACRRAIGGEDVAGQVETAGATALATRCRPLRDASGGITGAVCVATDVTELERTRRRLAESEARYRALVENTNDMSVAFDTDGRITYVGPQVERLGFSPDEVVSRSIFEFVSEDDREAIAADFRRTMETGEEFPSEFRMRDRDGGLRWFEEIGKVQRDEEGQITGIIGILRDVTDRKRAEEELRQARDELERRVQERTAELQTANENLRREIEERKATEERLCMADAAIDKGRDLAVWVGSDARILRVNDAACEALGYSSDELLAMKVHEVDALETEDTWPDRWAEFGRRGSVTFESILRARDGREFPIEVTATRVEFDGNRMLFAYVHDITERRRAEEKLKDAERRTRAWLEHSPVCTKIVDLDFNLQYMSSSGIKGLKIQDTAQLYGKPYPFDLYPGSFRRRITENLTRARDTGEVIALEGPVVDTEGNEHWYQSTIVPVHDTEGRVEYLIVVSIETTERKRVEDALRLSEEKFRQFFENEPEYCYMVSPEGLFLDVNRAALDALGYAREELVGKPVDTIYPPESLPQVRILFEKWRETGSLRNEEVVIATKTGRRRTVLLSSSAVRNGNGRLRYSVSVQRDITERKRAQKKIIEQNEFMTQVLESLTHPFYVIDANNYRVVLANSAANLGSLTDASTCHMLTHGSAERCRAPEHLCPLEEVKRTGKPVTVEHMHLGADGRERTVEIHAYPILDGRGEVVRMIEYNIDITERREAEEEIRRLAKFPSENPNPVMRLDGDGTIIYANSASDELLREWQTGTGGRAPDRWRDVVATALETGSPQTGELTCCGRVYLAGIAPVAEAGYANLYASDITERKAAEDALRQESDFVARIMEGLSDAGVGLDVVDANCAVLYQNRMLADRFGSPDNRPCYAFYMSRDEPCEECPMMRAIASGEAERAELKGSNGRLYEVLSTPLPAPEGEVGRTLEIVRDITERKRAEEELRESQGFVRTALDAQLDTFFLFEPATGSAVQWNRAFRDVSGYTDEEIAGLPAPDTYYGPEDLVRARDFMQYILKEGTGTIELELLCRDGRTVPTEYRVSVIRDEQGRPRHIISIGRDITERKRAEGALRDERARLESIIRTAPVGIGVTVDRLIVEGNEYLRAMVGFPMEELIGHSTRLVYVTDDEYERVGAAIREGLAEKGTALVETRFRRKDGADVDVLLSVAPIDPADPSRGLMNIFLDMTDRKRAEDALRESEGRFRSVVESSPMGIYLYELEPDGRLVVVGANPATDRILGVDNSKFIGMTIEEAFPPLAKSEVPGRYRRAAAYGEQWQTTEFAYEHEDISGAYDMYAFQTSPGKMAVMFLDVTERERAAKAVRDAQEALRESERKFRSVVEAAPMGMFETDAVGRVLYTNPKWCSITGMSHEDSLGFGWAGAIHPDDRDRILAEWDECLREKKGYSGRFRFVRPSGEVRLVYTRTTPILDEGGNVIRHVGANEDITERDRAVGALRESEERFRALTESTSDFVWEVDAEGVYTYVSPRVRELLGYEPGEVVGRTPFDLMPPDEAERVRDSYAAIKEAGEAFAGLENTNLHRDGRCVVIESGGVPFFDEEGRLRGYRGIDRDITERKHAEIELRKAHDELERRVEERTSELAEANRQLRRSEETYRSLVTHLPDAVTVTRPDGIIKYVSGHRAELHGASSVEEMLGRKTADLVVPHDRERFEASLRHALETGAAEAAEFSVLRRDGSTFIAEESFGVLRDSDGRPNSVVTVARDVTGRKELETRLVESQRLEAVGRLAGGLAHDFNNLLTAIGGFASRILKKIRPDTPIHADATQIRKASDMAASLTSQLLAFSRRQIMQPVILTLNEVLADIETMLRRLLGEDIELVITPQPALGLTMADSGQIGQVIVNLAVNARDAMPLGGVLTIKTAGVEFGAHEAADHPGVPPGEYVTVSVTDTGSGIPPDILPHIFEPFYTTKEKGKGTGLGLSTVYGIVTQSGGHMRVSSEVDHGSSFVIYLPRIAQATEAGPETPPTTAAVSLTGDETILLVEDEDSVRDLTSLTLADYGYRVLEASNGDEAVALAAAHDGPIHLLLTDVVMPKMSGREVATRVVASRPDTSVIFMSGYTDNVEVRGAGAGDAPLVTKPFGEEDLVLMVREVLDSARERKKTG